MTQAWYREDLAYIHDVGYRDYAVQSAPGLLDILSANHIWTGLVVDLGCGSGLWAQELTKAGYQVLGIDISEAMIAIARRRVPEAEFWVASWLKIAMPPCVAVTSIGECLNYVFDADQNRSQLGQLFHRIYHALAPGGVFVFDLAEPGQLPSGSATRSFTTGEDWVVLVEKAEDPVQEMLTRRIITFRRVGQWYRRDEEVHPVRLYKAAVIEENLRQAGFAVQTMYSYGAFRLPHAHVAFVARKPSSPACRPIDAPGRH